MIDPFQVNLGVAADGARCCPSFQSDCFRLNAADKKKHLYPFLTLSDFIPFAKFLICWRFS